jgi:uncharacterized protein
MKMNALDWIAWILVIVGGLNWGLVGVTSGSFNLVDAIFGVGSTASMVVYVLVGLGALWMIISAFMMMGKKKR